MAINQTNRLAWIVKTIYKARKITFEELARKWDDDDNINDGKPLLKRTFIKWKWLILDTFGVDIECEKGGEYRYYILNVEDLRDGSIDNWLLNTYSVSNSLLGCKSIKDKIILEEIPSGVDCLDSILDALKQNRCIHILYYNYWRGDEKRHYVMPLCVKLFRQRWYMVGQVWANGERLIYCLDRIQDFRFSSHTFEYPKDFSPEEYFAGCFGVITDKPIQHIRLKINSAQANYMRGLPMHPSQRETERNEQYSIFELDVRPTFDFKQELLWNGPDVEVLEPAKLRNEIAEMTRLMYSHYVKKEDGV